MSMVIAKMGAKGKIKKLFDLALRRGFFYATAEIYPDRPAGFWDYGPLGTIMKRRIIEAWRKMIVRRDQMLEIDGSQIMPESVFKASGHLRSFVEPLTVCKRCKQTFRASRLIQEKTGMLIPEALSAEELDELIDKNKVKCSKCMGDLSKVVMFNMMFMFEAGPKSDSKVGLRPETCQSIFLSFPRLYNIMRVKLPIGIAQVGRAYRNEISPRQGLVRLREFTQAEVEVFFNPKKINEFEKFDALKNSRLNLVVLNENKQIELSAKKAVDEKIVPNKLVAYYLVLLKDYYKKLGIRPQNMRFRELSGDERPFYAQSAFDLEIRTSFGWLEVVANHDRADYDLKVHSKGSKTDLGIIENGEKILPWVWEASMGIDRTLLVTLDAAYTEEKGRAVLKLPSFLAPIRVSVLPLVSKNGLAEKAIQVYDMLKDEFDAEFDEKDSIGRRYYRMDEIGVPFAITIDYDTLNDETVTIRERDSKEQIRIKISELKNWLLQSMLTTESPIHQSQTKPKEPRAY